MQQHHRYRNFIAKGGLIRLFAALATSVCALRLGVQHGKPERPPLTLTFQADLRSERLTGPDVDATEIDVRHIALDEKRFSLALLPHRSSDRANSGGVVVDILRNLQIQVEPFFDHEVCFAFDMTNGQQKQPVSSEDAAMVFKAMADDVFGVPLALYEKADLHEGSMITSGRDCNVWTSRLNTTIHLPSAREFYAVAARLRLSSTALRYAKQSPQADLLLQANTSFCVDEFGRLHLANTSQRAVLLDPEGMHKLLRYDIASATLVNVNELDEQQGSVLFQPGRNASGGHCIDLTSGTAYHEMHKELNDGHRIERINSEARGGWEAGPYQHWDEFSVKDIVHTLGTTMRPLRLPLKRSPKKCNDGNPLGRRCRFAESVATPPLQFDARKHWSHCDSIRTIRNQGSCGSCWAVAAASVLADRICIETWKANMSKTHSNFNTLRLSPQYLLDCDEDGGACNGGHLDDAWEFLESDGIPEESCDPYAYCMNASDPACGVSNPQVLLDDSSIEGTTRQCPGNCNGQIVQTFRAQHVYAVSAPGDVPTIQQEIYQHGPVEAAFFVFSDFHNYRRGTYSRTPSAVGPLGGHAVRLVGWGVDKHKKDFWTVANSFGAKWGMKGFFRILRGTNECGIETMPAAGVPLLSWQEHSAV